MNKPTPLISADRLRADSAWLGRELDAEVGGAPAAQVNRERPRALPAEPEPLRRPLPPAEPYPLDALGRILAPAVLRVREIIQAPAAMCAQSFLSAASLAAQPFADVLIDGRRELLSLYALSIGESGERKTAVDNVALRAHQEFERANLDKWESDYKQYEIEKEAYDAARRAATSGKIPKEVENDAREYIRDRILGLGEPPKEPRKPILLAGAPTLEALHQIFAKGRPTLGLYNNDAGDVFGGHSMNAENCLKTAAGLSKLWDCGAYDRLRVTDGLNKYFGRRLAFHLMIQPVVAEQVLSNDILIGQGLLARSLLEWPDSTIGYRPYNEVDISQDPALLTYARAIMDLLQRELPYRELRNGELSESELDPPAIQLTPPAKQTWIAIHDAIEEEMRPGGVYANVRAWGAKAAAQILRIAGVLTLLERGDATDIHAEAVERGAALMRHYLGEARRIVGHAMIPSHIQHAEAILQWCRDRKQTEVSSSELLQSGPNVVREIEALSKAMQALERTGWAIPVEGGKVRGGAKRRRVWTIHISPPVPPSGV